VSRRGVRCCRGEVSADTTTVLVTPRWDIEAVGDRGLISTQGWPQGHAIEARVDA
jgi:hypothetical protein